MKDMLKEYWSEFKKGTNTMFKEFFNKDTNKKQRANMWTFTRLITPTITVICSIIAIITASIPMFVTTGIIAGFGAFTDKLDGASAKKHKSYSEYGKILDQITDKSFAGIIGINLLFLNFNYIYLLLGELAIALVNVSYKLKHKDLNINSTFIGKVKQTPLFTSLALGYLSTINPTMLLISNISIILSILFQIATAVSYVDSNNKSVKKLKKDKIKQYIEKLNNEEEEKEKIKTKVIESNNDIEKNNEFSISEQCEKLKEFKNELISENLNNEFIDEKGYQKTKK